MIGTGFSGTFEEAELIDLISLAAASGKPMTISVREGDRRGSIYIERSKVRHAIASSRTGLEALFEMVSWQNGESNLKKGVPADLPRSITQSLDYVLLACSQQLDLGQGSGVNAIVASEVLEGIMARAQRRNLGRRMARLGMIMLGIVSLGAIVAGTIFNWRMVENIWRSRGLAQETPLKIPAGGFIYGDGER